MATQQPPPVDTNTTTTPVVPKSQIKRQPAPIEVPVNVTPIPLSEIDRAPAPLPVTSTPVVIPLSSIDTAPAAVTEDPAVANDAPPVVSDVAELSETVLPPPQSPVNVIRSGPIYLPVAQDGTVVVPRTSLLNFLGNGVTVTSVNGLVANITIAGSTSYGDANVTNLLSSGIAGNIIPSANTTWNLGNATNQWNSLWVASNTIYIGGVPLSVAPGNTLTLAGEPLLSNDSNTTITTTGNITANYIIGDGAQISNVAWANITGAPSFITLGNLSVTTASPSGNGSLTYNNTSGVFTYTPADANLSQYGDTNVAVFLAAFGSNAVSTTGNITADYFIGNGSQLTGLSDGTAIVNGTSQIDIPTANGPIYVGVNNVGSTEFTALGINTLDLAALGNVTADGTVQGNVVTANSAINTAGTIAATGNISAGNISTDGNITATGNVSADRVLTNSLLSETDVFVQALDGVVDIRANGNVVIKSADANYEWVFDTNGDLTVPNYINFEGNTYIGDEPGSGSPSFRIVAPLTYGATIETDSDISGNSWTWTFGADGVLGAPGNITATNFIGNMAATNVTGLANVATTGAYADLTGTPTIPSLGDFTITDNTIQTDNGIGGITLSIFGPDATDPPAFISQDWIFANTGAFTSPGAISATGNITATGNVAGDVGLFNDVNLNNASTNRMLYVNGDRNIYDTDFLYDAGNGSISGSGNITAGYFIGDGSQLTNLPTSYSDSNVANFLAAFGSNSISTTGNVTANNFSGNTEGFAIGYRDIPQIAFTGNTTLAASDAGKHYYSTLSTANVLTIADNSNVAWLVGTAISVVNRGSANITIARAPNVSLYLAGNSTVASRTLTTYGMATLLNVAANVWMINGTGIV